MVSPTTPAHATPINPNHVFRHLLLMPLMHITMPLLKFLHMNTPETPLTISAILTVELYNLMPPFTKLLFIFFIILLFLSVNVGSPIELRNKKRISLSCRYSSML